MLLPLHLNLAASGSDQSVNLPVISSTSVFAMGVVNTIITPTISSTALYGQTIVGSLAGGNLLLLLFSLNLDTITGDQNLSLPVISSTQIFAPSTAYVVVNAAIASGSATFSPTLEYIILLPVISGTVMFAPVIAGSDAVSLPSLTTGQIFAPSVAYIVASPLIGPTSQRFTPAVFGDNTIVLPTISSTTLYTATVAASVGLPLLSGGTQVFAPSLSHVVVLPTITGTIVHAPTVVKDNDLATPELISTVLFPPSLAYTMTTAFLPSATNAFAPAISYVLQNAVISGSTVFAPVISHSLLMPLIPSGAVLYSLTVFPDGFVVLPFIAAGSVLRTPIITQPRPDLEFVVRVVTRLAFQSKVT